MNIREIFQHKPWLLSIGFLLAVWLIFFSRILFGGQVYFLDDLKIIYYPLEHEYAQALRNWELPQWSNEFGFGHPLMAWGQLGFFTPIHLILRLLQVHPLWLLQISILSYTLIGLIGMYTFLTVRRLSSPAAVLGAVLFVFCGFTIGHLNHVNFYTSTMLLPWILLCIHYLLEQPNILRTSLLSLVAASIVVSGQPQVVLFTFVIATFLSVGMAWQVWRDTKPSSSHILKVLVLTLIAGLIAFGLSSSSILPLFEFLPQTERVDGLPPLELLEFSYPPWHSITLILPYFFGDHEQYWGAKSFQELAAFVGLLPLLLAGSALVWWRTHVAERLVSLVLVAMGIVMMLGEYSPLYTYLVENHYITSIGVVGRFIFFFDIGILLLAAIGLHDWIKHLHKESRIRQIMQMTAGFVFIILLIGLPVSLRALIDTDVKVRIADYLQPDQLHSWLVVSAAFLFVLLPFMRRYPRLHTWHPWIMTGLATVTVISYSWNYNPLTPAARAFNPSPLGEELLKQDNFKRLYASESLPVTGNKELVIKLTDRISPNFAVFQPLKILHNNLRCVEVPIHAGAHEPASTLTVTLREGFSGTIINQKTISSLDVVKTPNTEICFEELTESMNKDLILSFTSDKPTSMRLFFTPQVSEEERVYFFRVPQPTPSELARSQKDFTIQYRPIFKRTADIESALMVRHLHTLYDASSARWIGALSVRPYREFIEAFFANDTDAAIDGENIHVLTRYRNLVNMSGITHFTQALDYGTEDEDAMLASGYTLAEEANTGEQIIRLYENSEALPKAFLVHNAEWKPPADETRYAMMKPDFDPTTYVYLNGPVPPATLPPHSDSPVNGSARITRYETTRVDVEVTTPEDTFLILTDTSTPEWQTFIDDKPSLLLVANTLFKAAYVPAGTHTVSFRYSSPAIRQSMILSLVSLLAVLGLLAWALLQNKMKRTA